MWRKIIGSLMRQLQYAHHVGQILGFYRSQGGGIDLQRTKNGVKQVPNSSYQVSKSSPQKVWVTVVRVWNISSYCPTSEFRVLKDAISSTIAWPSKYIRVGK
ncbi:hypothetical protein ACFX2I_014388 [Malus domestica]